MQRFTLLHNGSVQSWQTAYLTFHIAARLGAPLQVLIIGDSTKNKMTLAQWAAQVETGGRAAGVAVETDLLMNFSLERLMDVITTTDGLFAPHHFIPDGKTAALFLDAFSCPLWVTSKESDIREMAVLVENLIEDGYLISYTKTLSYRLQQPLIGLIKEGELALTPKDETSFSSWTPLSSLSLPEITFTLKKLNISLLFITAEKAFMVGKVHCNFVILPKRRNA